MPLVVAVPIQSVLLLLQDLTILIFVVQVWNFPSCIFARLMASALVILSVISSTFNVSYFISSGQSYMIAPWYFVLSVGFPTLIPLSLLCIEVWYISPFTLCLKSMLWNGGNLFRVQFTKALNSSSSFKSLSVLLNSVIPNWKKACLNDIFLLLHSCNLFKFSMLADLSGYSAL